MRSVASCIAAEAASMRMMMLAMVGRTPFESFEFSNVQQYVNGFGHGAKHYAKERVQTLTSKTGKRDFRFIKGAWKGESSIALKLIDFPVPSTWEPRVV